MDFTLEQAKAIYASQYPSNEDAYSPQEIFDQVWESPAPWFELMGEFHHHNNTKLPATVAEISENGQTCLSKHLITEDIIINAAIKLYFDKVLGVMPFSMFISNLDAIDVDNILQVAMFGEVRYS